MITLNDIQAITRACKPLPTIALTYLKKRGLKPSKGWQFIYEHKINELQTIKFSIAMPITNITGNIQGYEFRVLSNLASDKYSKTFTNNLIPAYNCRNPRYRSKVVITEGIFDCEALYQHSYLNVISILKANPSTYVLHIIAFLYSDISLVLDQDKTGVDGAKKIKKFLNKFYPDIYVKIFNIKDYTKDKEIKDPNDLLRDKKGFRKLVKDLT